MKTGIYLRVASLAALIVCLTTRAAELDVTSTIDSTSITSLRGAIIHANSTGGNNTIILTNSIYQLTIAGSDEDAAATGDLDVKKGNITIIGNAASPVIINATNLGDRVFQVLTNAQLTLSNIVVSGGTAPGNNYGFMADGEPGGAIYNAGTLILKNCVVTNNSSGGGNYVQGNGGGTSGGDGGGIYNAGALIMTNCVIAENFSGGGVDGAFGGNGGGLCNAGICSLTNCLIVGNSGGDGGGPGGNAFGDGGGGGSGGGIYNSGAMTLRNCAVSGNSSGTGAGGGDPGNAQIGSPGGFGGTGGSGAGIFNAGNLKLNSCTMNNNTTGAGGAGGNFGSGGNPGVGGDGGGIFNAEILTLTNCTISSNTSGAGGNGGAGNVYAGVMGGRGGDGAGIYNASSLLLESCTIALNKTGVGGKGGNGGKANLTSPESGGSGGSGGGLLNATNGSTVLLNSLIALNATSAGGWGGTNNDGSTGNPGTDGLGRDLAGNFDSQGFNLIGVADGSLGITNGLRADLVGSVEKPINPLLGPLQNNGGFTSTHALMLGSPAIDQGKSFGLVADQRGRTRPHDYVAISNAAGGDGADIGAVESDLPILSLAPSAVGMVISWDTNSPNYILQSTTNLLSPDDWTTVPGTALIVNQQFTITNHIDAGQKFFRLRDN